MWKKLIRAGLIGVVGAFIIWILSGSSASIGFGLLFFYIELKDSRNAEQKSAQK